MKKILSFVCFLLVLVVISGAVSNMRNFQKVVDNYITPDDSDSESSGPELLLFTVGSSRYYFEEGMDWFTFIDSSYESFSSCDFYICDDLHVHCNFTDMVIFNEYEEPVEITDIIEEECFYYREEFESEYVPLEFTVGDYEPFEYEEGMSWNDVVNTYEGFSIDEDGYVIYEGWFLQYLNGGRVTANDEFNGGYFIQSEKVSTETESEILQFTVDTMTFYFEEGMDWVDFVNSDYNVLPDSSVPAFSLCDEDDLHIHYNSDDSAVYDEELNLIEFDSCIVSDGSYQLGENPH